MADNSTFVMNVDLLKLLECHVCLKPMAPPIIQCENGHNVCNGCKKHLDNCATCKSDFVSIRNRLAEDLALKLPYPCGNSDVGCNLTLLGSELESHGLECPYRIYGCLFKSEKSCIWTGRKDEILEHIKSEHPKYVIEDGVNKFKWSITEETNCKRIISTFGELFVFVRWCMVESKITAFYLQYIGEVSCVNKFRYHIELQSHDKIHNISFSSKPISDLMTEQQIIDSGEFFTLTPGNCNLFANNAKEVLYELKITSMEFCPSDDVKYSFDVVS